MVANPMNVVLHIPDDFAERLGADGDVERLALEGLALDHSAPVD